MKIMITAEIPDESADEESATGMTEYAYLKLEDALMALGFDDWEIAGLSE